MKTPQDIYGRDIQLGQWISYPMRQSSSLWIEHGKVTGIVEVPHRYGNGMAIKVKVEKLNGKSTQIESLDRCTIAPDGWVPSDKDSRFGH
jgi:hypothetical protein